jgi:hypothetical protein
MDRSSLAEFLGQVVDSHAWLVAEILAGEQPDMEIFVQLGAEILATHKLTILQCQNVATIAEARSCWQSALDCFRASEELMNRLSADSELLENHRRLLERRCRCALDQLEIYSEAESEMSYRRRKSD